MSKKVALDQIYFDSKPEGSKYCMSLPQESLEQYLLNSYRTTILKE